MSVLNSQTEVGVVQVTVLYLVRCSYRDVDSEPAWNAWYSGLHVPEMLTIPGFDRGRRYQAVDPERPEYVARYELTSSHVLESDAYQAASGGRFPDPWSSNITDFSRWLYVPLREEAEPGEEISAGLFVVDVEVPTDIREQFSDWYDSEHLPLASRAAGCSAGRRYLPLDAETAGPQTIMYEFESAASLRRFIAEDVPDLMKSFDARWGTSSQVARRTRRALAGRRLA
jgi:uncharacterized protein DUF4286